jgi:hypothetical protein
LKGHRCCRGSGNEEPIDSHGRHLHRPSRSLLCLRTQPRLDHVPAAGVSFHAAFIPALIATGLVRYIASVIVRVCQAGKNCRGGGTGAGGKVTRSDSRAGRAARSRRPPTHRRREKFGRLAQRRQVRSLQPAAAPCGPGNTPPPAPHEALRHQQAARGVARLPLEPVNDRAGR